MFYIWKLNFLKILEYKTSFFIQSVFMMINNGLFVLIWYFFFQKFNTIGGWTFEDYILLLGYVSVLFGFLLILFAGIWKLPRMISEGKLDNYLLLPKNPLITISVSDMWYSSFGDLLFGVLILFLLPEVTLILILKMLFFAFISSVIFAGFLVCFISLGFWIGNSHNLFKGIFESVLGPSMYPSGIYEGSFIKIILMTIVPVFFITFIPHSLILDFSLEKFTYYILFAIFIVCLAFYMFFKGLKRYESGNMMVVNN